MKVSARNLFRGRVTALQVGAVNAEVELATPGGDVIVAIVSNEAVRSLGLSVGAAACAMVKAPSIILMVGSDAARLSARNCLQGVVTTITQEAVNAEVTLTLPGGAQLQASIARQAIAELGLRSGMAATAVIKASSVIIATV